MNELDFSSLNTINIAKAFSLINLSGEKWKNKYQLAGAMMIFMKRGTIMLENRCGSLNGVRSIGTRCLG
jgi:hypothetical protein